LTCVFFGERELIVDATTAHETIDCSLENIVKGSQLELYWRQQSIKPKILAFINPPDPVKSIEPRPDRFVLITGEPRKAWKEWTSKHKVALKACRYPEENTFAQMLVTGAAGVTLTQAAADWYVRMVGTSFLRLSNELIKLSCVPKNTIDCDDLILLIGGVEELKAEKVLKSLGTATACRLALEVSEQRSMPLLGYMDKALQHRRNSWWFALKSIQEGIIRKRLTPWAAVQVFVQYCYETAKTDRLEADLMLELLGICGQLEEGLDTV
jgi:hypothetical protein